jgi:molecular chaperone GrpE
LSFTERLANFLYQGKKKIMAEHKADNSVENESINSNPDANASEAGPGTENVASEELAEDWESKFKKSQDEYVRLYAEFENYRRRTNKERLELTQTASSGVIKELLPVIDDFERALTNSASSEDAGSVIEGVRLIYNKFLNILKAEGVEEIDALGQVFNPDIHEALTHIPAGDEAQKGCVLDVVEKGYKVKDKIIRHPKVVVGS